MKQKKIILTIITALILTFIFSSSALTFELKTDSAILLEAKTGQLLFEKNSGEKLPPASMMKIMTLLIAMEKLKAGEISLNDQVTISSHAESMGGSQIFLAANTQVKMEKLLKAVTIASANDASVAIAEHIAGTYSSFIALMNDKAEKLGLESTNFANSTGLPAPNNYSTALDISIMARELIKYPQILKWASIWTETIKLPEREAMLVNTNNLINKYPAIDGLKTGHTEKAGYCLAATAKKGDTRLISVVFKGKSFKKRDRATTKLLDYGFNAFSKKKIVQKGAKIQNIAVAEAADKFTVGEVAAPLYLMVKKGQEKNISQQLKIKEKLKAPLKKG